MHLDISDPDKVLDRDFLVWLISELRNHIITHINPKKLIKWDEYLNSSNEFVSIYKKRLSAADIITAGAMNLMFIEYQNKYSIQINPSKLVPGLDRVKLQTICKLINFGNRAQASYPLFTDSFEYFAENIQTYVDRWVLNLV